MPSLTVRLIPCALIVTAALAASLTSAKPAPRPDDAARAFLATLSDDERKQATYGLSDAERTNWIFVPRDDRKGLPFWSMAPQQQEAALALLSSCLSAQGYQRVQSIRQLELVLRQMESAE